MNKKTLSKIENIPAQLKAKIKSIGIVKSAEICELKQPDVSAWINGKRNWSLDKIIRLYNKLTE